MNAWVALQQKACPNSAWVSSRHTEGTGVAKESGTNRWWENYLVRYLMPSIAGVAILGWLCAHAGDELCALLFLPPHNKPLDATALTLLFLYGNLFCYVASYPVLVFHATRVIDFSNGKWPAKPLADGYISVFVITILAFALFHVHSADFRYYAAFGLALLLTGIQFVRLYQAICRSVQMGGLSGSVSQAFAYAYALARRRGIPEETSSSKNWDDEPNESTEFGGEVTTSRTIAWRREFVETYRHLREHGNSAFIFLFEIALAALVYSVIKKQGQTPVQQMGAIGTLFAIWAFPSIFVHFLGQHFERRFSWFDRRIGPAETQADSHARSHKRTGNAAAKEGVNVAKHQ